MRLPRSILPPDSGRRPRKRAFPKRSPRRSYHFEALEAREVMAVDFEMFEATAPAQVFLAQTLDIYYRVGNVGVDPTDASFWTDKIYLSADDLVDEGDATLASFLATGPEGGPVGPGTDYSVFQSLSLAGRVPGFWNLLFVANAGGEQSELFDDNNTIVLPLEIRASQADLAPVDLQAPESASAGETISVNFRVENLGTTPVSEFWTDQIYLSDDNIWSPDDQVLSIYYPPSSLDPGVGYDQTVGLFLDTTQEGAKYLILVVDPDDTIEETDDANNTIAVPITLRVPDLEVSELIAPTDTVLGGPITFSYTVTNIGAAPTGADNWYDIYYLSDDEFLDAADALVGNSFVDRTGNPVGSGDSFVMNPTITLGSGSVTNQFLIVVVNEGGYAQPETSTDNNTIAVPIALSAPDLVVTDASAPGVISSGQTITVNWTVENQSATPAPGLWSDFIFLSTDDILDDADQFLTFRAAFPLDPFDSYSGQVSVRIEPAGGAGNYFVLVAAARFNGQPDADPSNNVFAVPIEVGAADLTITTASGPSAAVSGQSINVSWTVQNIGDSSATVEPWYDYVVVSNDQTLDFADQQILVQQINAVQPLAAGASYTIARSVNLNNVAPGSRYLIFVADRAFPQPDSDETNNTFVLPIEISAPDLVPHDFTGPAEARLGETVAVSWEVTNQGAVAALGNWSDVVYLSTDNVFDFGDRFLDSRFTGSIAPFAPGANYIANLDVEIPSTATEGPHYLLVFVNQFAGQAETDKANNVLAIPINLVRPAPNLTVSAASAPASANLGQLINVSWTVDNIGVEEAGTAWNDYVYVSDDTSIDASDRIVVNFPSGTETPLAAGDTYTRNTSFILQGVGAGTKYLIFRADALNNQVETDESDNQFVLPISVSAADLVVEAARATSEVVAGTPITLEWTVRNIGTITANNDWNDAIYISTDATYNPAVDPVVAYFDMADKSPLAAGAGYTVSRQITLPITTVGQRYLFVVAQGFGSQPEASFTNNASGPLSVNILPVVSNPDLVVTAASAPTTAAVGQTIDVSFTVQNIGPDVAAQDWFDAIYLSSDTVLDAADQIQFSINQATRSPLGAGAIYEVQTSFALSSATAGQKYLLFKADGFLNQPESNENNNVFAVAITIPPTNLTILDAQAPESTLLGGLVTIEWTARNSGESPIYGNWADSVYISSDAFLSGDDTLLGFGSAPPRPFATGAEYTTSQAFIVPQTQAGERYLIIRLDGTGALGETNENDNQIVLPISIIGDDLVVDSVTGPASAQFGDSFLVGWTVRNQGISPAIGNWSDYIYLSQDSVIDGGDLLLTATPATDQSPLAAGGSYTRSVQVTLPIQPGIASGTYYLIAKAAGGGGVAETDTSNNTRVSAPIEVTVPPLPDLVVTHIVAPSVAPRGTPLAISWTLANQGTTTAAGSWVERVYLSADDTFDDGVDFLAGTFTFTGAIAAGASVERIQTIAIPDEMANFHVFVFTDIGGNIAEGDGEFNNLAHKEGTLNLVDAVLPNLVVTNVTGPADGILTGQTVEISFTVTNAGPVATSLPFWFDIVFLTQDPTVTVAPNLPVLLENLPLAPVNLGNAAYLNPGDSYTQTVEMTLLPDRPGPWYAYAWTDGHALGIGGGAPRMRELNDADNLAHSAAFQVDPAPTANLQVESAGTVSTVFSGDLTHITWTVINSGAGGTATDTWTDSVYFSDDDQWDSGDQLLATQSHFGGLGAGELYTASAQIRTPVGVSGARYLIFRTDSRNEVFENLFEGDNDLAEPISITLTPPPDLEVDQLIAPASALAGQTISVSYRATNSGATDVPAGGWSDAVYLSTDDVLDAGDLLVHTELVFGPHSVGLPLERTLSVQLPNGIAGEYQLFVVLDAADQVFELDNANNARSTSISLESRPANLITQAVAVPSSAATGAAILVQWTVANTGTGPTNTESWYDKVYLSTDDQFDLGQDFFLGRRLREGGLHAGQSYTQTQLFQLPAGPVGTYRVLVVADAPNRFAEDGSQVILNGPRAAVYEGDNEDDNATASGPIDLTASAADLIPTSVRAPASAATGGQVLAQWIIANQGSARSNVDFWYDDVYLSADPTFGNGNDVYLGGSFHSGSLGVGESYTAQKAFTLPERLAGGTYFLIVRTDRPIAPSVFAQTAINNVFESFELNNTAASGAFAVTEAPTPDLTLRTVTAPAVAYSGRTMTIEWTAANDGAVATTKAWYDAIYLSLDDNFDRQSDILLGSFARSDSLGTGATYHASLTVEIPAGLTGLFRLFVATDVRDDVFERGGEFNNALAAPLPLEILLTQPVDLVAGIVSIPAGAVPGAPLSITYSVLNAGTLVALGGWTDAVYLSTDDVWDVGDALLGRVNRNADLGVGQFYTQTLAANVPGIAPGEYRVIIRADVRNAVPETDEANNLFAALEGINVDVPTLTLGSAAAGTLGQGQAVYYRVEVGAGETLRVTWDGLTDASATELYVAYGTLPLRGLADFLPADPYSSDQEIVVPTTMSGTYYILAFASDAPGGSTAYSILAELVPFSITSASPATVGNGGPATIEIKGAKFDFDVAFSLVGPEGATLAATSVFLADSANAYATFDFTGAAAGVYTVVATARDGASATLADALEVQVGVGAALITSVTLPPRFFTNRYDTFQVNYSNQGDADMIAPLLILENVLGTPIGFSDELVANVPYLMMLGIGSSGPAGILRPGQIESLSIHMFGQGDFAQFNLKYLTADSTEPIDWVAFEQSVRPEEADPEEWDATWARIRARVGDTWGGMIRALAAVATTLSQRGERVHDFDALFLEMYLQESGEEYRSHLSGRVVLAADGTPITNVNVWAVLTDPNNPDPFDPEPGELLPVNAEEILLRRTATNRDGEFRFTDLKPGTYELFVDGHIAPTRRFFTVTATNDVAGVLFEVEPKPEPPAKDFTPEIRPTVDSEPQTVVDTAGRTHLLWIRDGMLWHAVNEGAGWTGAQKVADEAGSKPRIVYSDTLIDGTAPGLLAIWIHGVNNEADIHGSVARQLNDGSWQWSEIIVFSQNTVNDDSVAPVILADGTPLFLWSKRDATITDDTDLYYRAGWNSGLVFPTEAQALGTLSSDLLAARNFALAATEGLGTWQVRAAFKDVTKIPDWIPFIGGKYRMNFVGSAEGNFESKNSATLQLSVDYSFGPDTDEWEISGGVFGRWTAKNAQQQKCPAPAPDWQMYGTVGLKGDTSAFFDLKKAAPIMNWASRISVLKDLLKAIKFGPRVDVGVQLNGNWNPQKADQSSIRWPDTASGKVNFAGGGQAIVDVDLGWLGSLKGTAAALVGGFLEFDTKRGWRLNNPSEMKVTVSVKGELTTKIMIPDPLDPFGGGRVPLAGYVDYTKIWTGADFGLGSRQAFNFAEDEGAPYLYLGTPSVGTLTDYFETDGAGGRLGAQDDINQSAPAMITDATGRVFAATADDGGVHGYRFDVGTQSWTSLGIIAGTEGIEINKEGVKLAVDGAGRLIAVWTQSSFSSDTLAIDSTPEEILEVIGVGGDLYFATYDETTGLWSAASVLAVIPGMDGQLSLATAADGSVWAAWTNGVPEGDGLSVYTATWNQTSGSWSGAEAIHVGRVMSAPSISFVGSAPTIFWTENVNFAETQFPDTDIWFASRVGGTWSAPDKFDPTLSAQALAATLVASSESGEFLVGETEDEASENWFENTFEPPDPENDTCKPPPPPKKPPPPPPGQPGGGGGAPIRPPMDPNDILGPAGFGDEQFVSADQALGYQIRFENVPEAQAPAQDVVITTQLDADLDWRTFRAGEFGIGGVVYATANSSFFAQRVDLRPSLGIFVDVAGSVDVQTGIATWTFRTIDPATGERPRSGGTGFLPPNIADAVGEGFVRYTVKANSGVESGARIDAQASIVFNEELPLDTPIWSNTLDAVTPSSQVTSVGPADAGGQFLVRWDGTDDADGSALAGFDIYVSKDGGAFRPWLEDTTLREASFQGADGRSYAFYSVATDNAGRREAPPATADAAIAIEENLPPVASLAGRLVAAETQGATIRFRLGAADSSPADQAAGFSFALDWDGDGSADQSVNGPDGTLVEHRFASGTHVVGLVAIDRHGAASSASRNVVFVGTEGDDVLWAISHGNAMSLIGFQFGGPHFVPRTVQDINGMVMMFGLAGNDLLIGDLVHPQRLYLEGEAGDDVLVGSNNDDILDGGEGSDFLIAGGGDDVLVGGDERDVLAAGAGADSLNGGGGEDILIAAPTLFDKDAAAVFAIQAEWLGADEYAVRVERLTGAPSAPPPPAQYRFEPGVTFLDDDSVDELFGADDHDWFLADLAEDIVADLELDEVTTDIL